MEIALADEIDPEYLRDVIDILEDEDFLSLSQYRHHTFTTRFMHSVNVSYISWEIARKTGCDAKSAARAGLLHDFFLYDPKINKPTDELQAFCHPKVAAKTSREKFDITDSERDAILSHMFPLGPLPQNKEAWIISMADKLCACTEICHITIALARKNRVVVKTA